MKKTIKYSFMILNLCIYLFLLIACGREAPKELPLGDVNSAPEDIADEPVKEEAPSVIRERFIKDGKIQSYLTGEWIEVQAGTRRPLAVMIPNNTQALPQYGLSKASVIYEAPVEGRITRLMGIFENYDALDHIGPVRSSRDYFVYVAMGYQAIYCNWGLARPYVEELLRRDTVQNISAAVEGIHNPSDEAFTRIKRPGYATEFTGYLIIDGVKKAIRRHGYETVYGKDYIPPFTFAEEGYRAEYKDAPDAWYIYPGGKEKNSGGYGTVNPYFEYHPQDKLYYRFQNGKQQIDEYNGKQLAVSNIVLQYCHGEVRDKKDYLAFGVHGEGDALIFTGGKVIHAVWKRYGGDASPAIFYGEEGEEIIFNQGKTWICNIWDEYSEYVTYEGRM